LEFQYLLPNLSQAEQLTHLNDTDADSDRYVPTEKRMKQHLEKLKDKGTHSLLEFRTGADLVLEQLSKHMYRLFHICYSEFLGI